MKFRSFLSYQIKKWLPLLIVSAVIMASLAVILGATIRTSYVIGIGDGGLYPLVRTYDPLPTLWYVTLGFSFIYAYVGANYRYDNKAADSFRAFPIEERKVRRLRFALGYLCLALLFVFGFSICLGVYLPRLLATPEIQEYSYRIEYRNTFSNIYFLFTFLFVLVGTFLQYSFNFFLASLAGTKTNALLLIFVGNILLIFLPMLLYTTGLLTFERYAHQQNFLWAGIPGLSITYHLQIDAPLCKQSVDYLSSRDYVGGTTINYLCDLFTVIICLASGVYVLFAKEPSGEYWGAPESHHKSTIAIHYATFLELMVLCSYGIRTLFEGFVLNHLLIVLPLALLYVNLFLFRKKPKPTRLDLLIMGIGIVLYFLFLFLGPSLY